MEKVTVSSKGQIAIPRTVRDAMNLTSGTKLTLEMRGNQIVLSKDPGWRQLQGAASSRNLMDKFATFRRREREREDSRS